MDMWSVISQIGTPIALVAFLIASVATVIRDRQKNQIKILEKLPENERLKPLEVLNIPVDDLTKEQRFELAKQKLQQRIFIASLFAKTSIAILVIFAVLIVVAILIFYFSNNPIQNATKTPTVNVVASDTHTSTNTPLPQTSTSTSGLADTPVSFVVSITPIPTNTPLPFIPTSTFDVSLLLLTSTPPPATPEPILTRIQMTVEFIIVQTKVAELMKNNS